MPAFNISRERIIRSVAYLSAVVESRVVDDISSCVKIKASNGKLEMTTTSTEMSVTCSIEANISKSGEVAISAKVLSEIVKRLPSQSSLECGLKNASIFSISSGSSVFALSVTNFELFPIIEHGESIGKIQITAMEFLKLIEKTKMCMSNDEIRYNLNGIALDCRSNGIGCIATDGHRLGIAESGNCKCDYENHVIIPKKTALEICRLLSENTEELIEIDISARTIKILAGMYTVVSKLVDARFPNYKSIIPTGSITSLSFSSKDFIAAIERVSSVTHEKLRIVRFLMENGIFTIHSANSIYGSASEEISAQYLGEDLDISFNAKYLIDALSCIQSEFSCLFTGQTGAALIKDTSDSCMRYVIMPVRR